MHRPSLRARRQQSPGGAEHQRGCRVRAVVGHDPARYETVPVVRHNMIQKDTAVLCRK